MWRHKIKKKCQEESGVGRRPVTIELRKKKHQTSIKLIYETGAAELEEENKRKSSGYLSV